MVYFLWNRLRDRLQLKHWQASNQMLRTWFWHEWFWYMRTRIQNRSMMMKRNANYWKNLRLRNVLYHWTELISANQSMTKVQIARFQLQLPKLNQCVAWSRGFHKKYSTRKIIYSSSRIPTHSHKYFHNLHKDASKKFN